MPPTHLNPLLTTLIQNDFIQAMNHLLPVVGQYAHDLFYIIAAIELSIFGILWALKRGEIISDFILKVFKLGVIFFVITSFPYLMKVLINGFTTVAFQSNQQAISFIFNPSELWQFGFNAGISLLNLAVHYGTLNVGMSFIYLSLGFGILLLFGLIAAHIMVIIVGFYVVSLIALLLLPFGAFTPARDMFEKGLQQIICAGVRVCVLILIISTAVMIWSQFQVDSFSPSTTIEQPLGLFFISLVFFILIVRLPNDAAKVVGKISGNLFGKSSEEVSVSVNVPSTQVSAPPVSVTSVQAGTTIEASTAQSVQSAGAVSTVLSPPASAVVQTIGTPSAKWFDLEKQKGKIGEGAEIKLSISKETLKKLQTAMKERK